MDQLLVNGIDLLDPVALLALFMGALTAGLVVGVFAVGMGLIYGIGRR